METMVRLFINTVGLSMLLGGKAVQAYTRRSDTYDIMISVPLSQITKADPYGCVTIVPAETPLPVGTATGHIPVGGEGPLTPEG